MRISVSKHLSGRLVSKALLTVAAAALLAGCSNSIERFSNAYDNPSDADPVYTASVPKAVRKPAPRKVYAEPQVSDDETISESPVSRAPLPRSSSGNMPQYDYTENYKKSYKQPAPVAKPRYTAPSYEDTDYAQGETEITPVSKSRAANGVVTVKPGMTLYSIARANNVDPKDLAAYNRMKAPYQVWTGQKLRIPSGDTADADIAPAPKPRKLAVADQGETEITPVRRQTSSGNRHTVADGETLYSLGRKYGVSPFVIADANGLDRNSGLHVGQTIKIPGGSARPAPMTTANSSSDDQDSAPVVKPLKKKRAVLSLAEDENQTDDSASADAGTSSNSVPSQTGNLKLKPKAQTEQVADTEATVEKQVADAAPAGSLNMRWPLKGKVISEFGPKDNGLKNEGINIAVPEGTSIRAAESGVVAYAGNELKGYGNLVLIRHAGGYVTAYAHAKELLVKRGDNVKRGDVIAKAGQTGAVSSPQLHFEVRKGATALDPKKYLSSATAMN
ncbi:peptidoglycan DD-metalloendopeptidase family protein [Aestuariivirga sp.]|uniref:peptidoglycan DD-metalloendopeptidase family protein n=1 Tax=Aestuariivirga sp. TaxID=2650926 RepID=UPI0039E3DA08